MIGTDIAHYRITAKLGEGGMGAVYRATDTRLNREVAIKMLPPAFAQNPDRLARFTREAQVLASLNHPNIAAIYGVEEGALIMELVEGQNLRAPIPFQTALDYALQMADALEHAHEKGIVHRDLKPANIRITPEGKLKLLDFGLAKAVESVPTLANPDDSPTITELATSAGVILGTAGYMSPEQARGQRVDHRTDIWAYGVVLHEMLTGKALFKGGTVSDTIAAILSKDPDLKDAPARFRPLIGRCLQRDPHQRLGWIGEARHLLEAAPVNARPSNLMWVVATCLFALTAAGAGFALLRVLKPTNLPERRFTISPPGLSLSPESRQADISPDGRKIVYIAANQMWIRELERDEARVVEGSEDATAPFWSPDSQYVGFVIRNRLWKSAVAGGRPVDLAELSGNVRGVTWEADGRNILVSNGLGLRRVSSEGGKLGEYILAVDSIRS